MDVHAYLLIAPSLETSSLPLTLKQETADVRHLLADSFGIDEARWLVKESANRALGGGSHHFVIAAKSMTVEAQNALLKLFEEPPSGTVFHLIVPHAAMILPTLRSRLVLADKAGDSEADRGGAFWLLSLKDRIDTVAKLAKDEPTALGEIVRDLGSRHLGELGPEAKRSLLLAEKYVYNRGASRKMLLEELALSLDNK